MTPDLIEFLGNKIKELIQEEALRLGRILRPKPSESHAYFYSLVNRDTVEQDFTLNAGSFSSIRVTNTLSEAKIPFRF